MATPVILAVSFFPVEHFTWRSPQHSSWGSSEPFFFGLSKTHYPYLSSYMSKWWPFPWNMLLSPVTTIIYQSLTPRLIGLFGIHFAVISNAVVSSTLIMTPLSRIWALGGIYIRLIPRVLFICYYITSAYRGKKSMKMTLVINLTGCQNQLI